MTGIIATRPVQNLLERLHGVKQTASDRWLAKCPSHNDQSPSLSIRDLGDTFLVKCWAGCGGVEVMEAVGLSAADFFERRQDMPDASRRSRQRSYITVRELVEILDLESWVVIVSAQKAMEGTLTNADVIRLHEAKGKISRVLGTVRHG